MLHWPTMPIKVLRSIKQKNPEKKVFVGERKVRKFARMNP